MMVSIKEIIVNPGRRALDQAHIQALADSMAETRLLNPITIGSNFVLIAGFHRLEAAKRLGWAEIECTILDLPDLEAELAEIDENVVRKGLSGVEYSELLLRRKEIYETLHPEAKRGGDRKSEEIKLSKCQFDPAKSFLDDTAEKMGVSPRTVARQIQTAKNLTPEAKEILKQSGTKVSKKAALKLSRLSPAQQSEAATQLADGEIANLSEYRPKAEEHDKEVQDTPVDMKSTIESKTEEEPFVVLRKQYSGFKEALADLKNADRDFSCTPESFLDEFMCFAQKFRQDIGWYDDPYYQAAIAQLSSRHLTFLREQVNFICASARDFYKAVERTVKK